MARYLITGTVFSAIVTVSRLFESIPNCVDVSVVFSMALYGRKRKQRLPTAIDGTTALGRACWLYPIGMQDGWRHGSLDGAPVKGGSLE
ncbi:hypothetical protein BDV97DRAFT_210227 [Delphinella strobiligena]|nr:hypothetical protein BDV97DRAFT_210227 [Delphinella strobiligena]